MHRAARRCTAQPPMHCMLGIESDDTVQSLDLNDNKFKGKD